jgi:glycine betaine/proline transport system substrate-binding protein
LPAQKNWDGCIVKAEKDCANPKASAWTKSEVNTVVTANFKKNASVALDFVTKRVYPGDIMNGMLVYMADQQASGKDAAYAFLEKHGNVWEKWVSAEVAKKIKSSL